MKWIALVTARRSPCDVSLACLAPRPSDSMDQYPASPNANMLWPES